MAVPLPLTFRISPLVPNKSYTPQEFADAIASRLSIDTKEQLALFTIGQVAPTSNAGPWLKNGTTWYVWDITTGTYIPEILEYRSLRYIPSVTEPDHNIYTLWIKLDSTGKAQELRYYSGGAWKSVYDDSFLSVINQINEVAANQNTHPFRGDSNSDQLATAASDTVDIVFAETYDPSNVFAASKFTAPEDGYYRFSIKVNFQIDSGTPTGNTVLISLTKNGFSTPNDIYFLPIEDSNLGPRVYSYAAELQLVKDDVIGVQFQCSGTGAGQWAIKGNNTTFSGSRLIT